jgi:hypothetical protein
VTSAAGDNRAVVETASSKQWPTYEQSALFVDCLLDAQPYEVHQSADLVALRDTLTRKLKSHSPLISP